jgi:hypothetical protein
MRLCQIHLKLKYWEGLGGVADPKISAVSFAEWPKAVPKTYFGQIFQYLSAV